MVALKSRAIREGAINALDFGADPTGVLDSTSALQAAINALSDQSNAFVALGSVVKDNAQLFIPPGIYKITSELVWPAGFGDTISGAGVWNTKLRWAGAAGGHMLRMRNCRDVRLEGLCFDSGGVAIASAIYLQTDDTATDLYISTQNDFYRVMILGQASAVVGILIDNAVGATDNGDDLHVFDRVLIYDCTESCWKSSTGEQKDAVFRDCIMAGAPRCIYTTGQGGSFKWYGGFVYNITTAIFHHDSPGDPVIMQGLDAENVARLVLWDGETGNSGPVTIQSCRIATDGLHADGNLCVFGTQGPFDIRGNTFGQGTYAIPFIKFLTSNQGYAKIECNAFDSRGADVDSPIRVIVGSVLTFEGSNNYRPTDGSAPLAMAFTDF